jgi:hypothetical protein
MSPSLIASTGHSAMQAPQAMQESLIVYAMLFLLKVCYYLLAITPTNKWYLTMIY